MKKILAIVLMLAFVTVVFSGCNGFTAKSAMAATIDLNTATASSDLIDAKAGTIPDVFAKAKIAGYADVFAFYANAKTTNPFAYLFGGKTIWVNGEYATRLDRANVRAAETATRATTQPTAWLNSAIVGEATVQIDVGNALHGNRSTP